MIKYTKQQTFVLNTLKNHGSITKLAALHYNIGNVNDVIMRLREKGWDIRSIAKIDAMGTEYNSYEMIGFMGFDQRPNLNIYPKTKVS